MESKEIVENEADTLEEMPAVRLSGQLENVIHSKNNKIPFC